MLHSKEFYTSSSCSLRCLYLPTSSPTCKLDGKMRGKMEQWRGHLIRHCHNPLHVCYLKMRIIAAPAWFCHRPGHVINKSKHSPDYNSYTHSGYAALSLYIFWSQPDRLWLEFIWSIADVSSQQSNFKFQEQKPNLIRVGWLNCSWLQLHLFMINYTR